MSAHKQKTKKPFFPSFFEGLAYLSTTLQWLWLAVVYLPLLLKNDSFRTLFLPNQQQTETVTVVAEPAAQTSPVLFFVAVAVAVVFTLLTVIVLIKLPGSVARGGRKAAISTAKAMLPVITHHKQLPEKKRLQLTEKIVWQLRIAAAILPVIGALFVLLVPKDMLQLSPEIIIAVASGAGAFTFLWFGCEMAVSKVTTRAKRP